MPAYNRYLPLYLCGALLAAKVAGAVEPPALSTNALDRQNRLLAQELPAAATWLTAGSEEFLALWEPWSSSRQKGALLMLPAQGQTANGWGGFSYLRRKLPELGWATLSIALPAEDIPAALRLLGEAPDEPTAAEAQEAVAQARAEQAVQANQRIAAALEFLQQRAPGKRLVLLGEHTGATLGMAYLESSPSPAPISAIVLLDAKNGLPATDFNLPNALTEQGMPVLDLFSKQTPGAIAEARARKVAADVGQLSPYRQIELDTQAPFNALPTPATKYVEGFLRSISED